MGHFQITDEGRKFLATNPAGRLTRAVLMQFEPFRQFAAEMKERATSAARKSGASLLNASESVTDEEATPEERIESAFVELRDTLITDLRGKLTSVDPFRFEQIVIDLLVAMGYGGSRKEATEVTKKTGDEGIDGVALALAAQFPPARHRVARPRRRRAHLHHPQAARKRRRGVTRITSFSKATREGRDVGVGEGWGESSWTFETASSSLL